MVELDSTKTSEPSKLLWLRIFCFIACIPSLGALLAKLYGIASMQTVTLFLALPCCVGLVFVWLWAHKAGHKELAITLTIGFTSGIIATIAYDIIRVPFHLAGLRIFAPISTFGIWVADSSSSSRFTEVIGWVYHYSNGITLAIMYVLFMRKRHWAWAILWACSLETLAIFCPFGRIFSLSGNYLAIGIAYLGHIAYGLPLGWLTYKWDRTQDYLARMSGLIKGLALLIAIAAIVGPLLAPEAVEKDSRAVAGAFRVEGLRLNPDFLRINKDGQVQVHNPESSDVLVILKDGMVSKQVESGKSEVFSFPKPGIYQIYIETQQRSRSSFIIVEPVELKQ
jgi:hypothetical protein